ncbi:MAG: hypothetical protein QM817_30855 [Archangium sp.]
MIRWLWLLTLAAGPSEPTLAQRKAFAEQHRMKLSFDWKNYDDCQKVVGPAALRCDKPVWICQRGMSGGMCNGSFFESRGVTFELQEPTAAVLDATPLPELILEEEAGDSCPECECNSDIGITFAAGATEAQKERERREFAKLVAREHEKCLKETARRQKAERLVRKCTLLMVDPCRQEAFIRCTGKNVGDMALNKTLHFSFAQQSDGGAPLGGEWEVQEEE